MAYNVENYSCTDLKYGDFEVEVQSTGFCKVNFTMNPNAFCDVQFPTNEDVASNGDLVDYSQVDKIITVRSKLGLRIGYCQKSSF